MVRLKRILFCVRSRRESSLRKVQKASLRKVYPLTELRAPVFSKPSLSTLVLRCTAAVATFTII